MAQVDAPQTGDLSLSAAASCEVPADVFDAPKSLSAFLSKSLKQLLTAGEFRGRQAVLSIPSPLVFIRHVRAPRSLDDAALQSQLALELAGKVPLDPSRCALRHIIAGEVYGDGSGQQNEIILFAAAQQAINALLDGTAAAKLDVADLRIGPRAIVDCFAHVFRRKVDIDSVDLFVELGATSCRAIVARDGAIRFTRAIPTPATDDAATLRLVDELELCRRYYEATFPDKPIARLLFVGGGARNATRCQAIAQQMSLPAQVADPFVRFGRSSLPPVAGLDRREANPDWSTVVGLSLGAVSPASNLKAA
jgi:Tfp pilus assembly PilM family ATPase